MSTEPEIPPPLGRIKSSVPALCLAFLPSVMFLGILASGSHGQLDSLVFVVAFLATVVSCVASSTMLFRRKTGPAIAAGLLFLLLNLVVLVIFGYGALMSWARF